MLIHLKFPYLAEYKIRRGRVPKREWFVAEEPFNPRDIADGGATPVFRIGSTSSDHGNASPVILLEDGYYWPVQPDKLLPAMRPDEWAASMAVDSLLRQPESDQRGDLLDIKGMRDAVVGLRREMGNPYRESYEDVAPRKMEESPAHTVIHSTFEFCLTHVAAKIADMVVWKDVLYVRGGEPVIVLDLDEAPSPELTVCDSRELPIDAWGTEPAILRRMPFRDYEIFRADQWDQAMARAVAAVASGRKDKYGSRFADAPSVPERIVVLDGHFPHYDAAGLMARKALQEVRSYAVDQAPGPDHIEKLYDAAQKARDAVWRGVAAESADVDLDLGPRAAAEVFDALADRIDATFDPAADVFRQLHHVSVRDALRAASARVAEDLAAGLLQPEALSEEDDQAVAAFT